jgi:hypothetical protein
MHTHVTHIINGASHAEPAAHMLVQGVVYTMALRAMHTHTANRNLFPQECASAVLKQL